jgi:SAM-dependent methyltransferase
LANVSKDDYVIDLGSGDGRIAIAAVKRGATAFGVDLDPERIAQARDNAKKAGVEDRVTFERRNLFETHISKANVLTMYLLQVVNLQLRPRVLDELKPGSRVVSHAFDMGDWQADRSENVGGRRVLMWWVPAKVQGRWQGESGARKFTLDLTQQYQKLGGKATLDGREVAIKDARLRGAEIEVVLDSLALKGNVSGNLMQGANWKASRGS